MKLKRYNFYTYKPFANLHNVAVVKPKPGDLIAGGTQCLHLALHKTDRSLLQLSLQAYT